MNILLINNIASLHSTLATSLNKIENVECRYLYYVPHPYISENEYGIQLQKYPSRKNPINYIYQKYSFKNNIRKWIDWADVLYYMWDSINEEYDLEYAFSKNKKIYIEWVGSDIRNPDLLKALNPYYADNFQDSYEYKKMESSNFRNKVQARFAKYNAKPILCPEMTLYLNKDLFPNFEHILQRINVAEILPVFPDPNEKIPVIVHSPSALNAKGTSKILEVIQDLKNDYSFEFHLLHNVSRAEVWEMMKKADIYIDQIIIGAYGMAATEAMSLGKPVFSYMMPELFANGQPANCPIVNTNCDNLKDNLIRLLKDGKLRWEFGTKSREYAEKNHDSDLIAKQLLDKFIKEMDTDIA